MPTQRVPRQAALAPTRSVRYRILPVPDVTTGGGPCQPTASWDESFALDDSLQAVARFLDSLGATDDVSASLGLADSFSLDDFLAAVVAAQATDSLGITEDALRSLVQVFDTVGIDESVFTDVLAGYADTIGLDDLMVDTLVATAPDTLGVADAPSFFDVFASWTEPRFRYALLPGGATNRTHFFFVNDAAPLDVLGDIDIRVAAAADDWTPTAFAPLIAKWNNTAAQRSYALEFDNTGTGKLIFAWSANGSGILSATSTVAPTVADGELLAIRVTLDVDDGAGNRVVTFYTKTTTPQTIRADLQDDSGWTVLGVAITQAGTTSIFASTTALSLGVISNLADYFVGKMFGAVIKNGIAGPRVFDWLAADATGPYATVTDVASALPVLPFNVGFGDDARYGPLFGFRDGFMAPKVGLFDTIGADDRLQLVTLKPFYLDTFALDDSFVKASFRNILFGATADGDSWVDQANPNTTHGADVLLDEKPNTVPLNDEKRMLLQFDFTRFVGLTAFVGGTHRFVCVTQNNSVAADNHQASARFSLKAAQPFTEGTVTWNNQPAEGTLVASATLTFDRVAATRVVTFTDANLNDFLGDWVYLRVVPLGGEIDTTTLRRMHSREAVTVTDRPFWDFDLKR